MSKHSNIDSIFCSAIEIELPEERDLYVRQICGGDKHLQSQLIRLLNAHFHGGSILDSPANDFVSALDHSISEKPGAMIGPYKLLDQVGEGGFGVVFMAEQSAPVRRKVALKIIKPGMDTRQVIARFEAERQALAMMDHPNIAKVFDAGATENGRPYFVMELVQGVPITEYCDQCSLTTRERLELFITVCQAVQHAHQKGVIHRDIKPTNVLVAMQDGCPAPKIIDFGVAKAINQPLTEHTLTTAFAQMVGSPLYMSPEQAELSPLGVDTRSDIYSLGVLMYELLAGTTPFDKDRLHAAPYDEMRRIIREEEPPRPSARISTLAAEVATTVAEHRRTDARRLSQRVRGELDWIVMKCLEKDRNRRYETPNSLARDIERFLRDEPVQACPPSALYRFRKFALRNKRGLVVAGLVLSFLVALGSGVGWMVRDRAARHMKVAGQIELIFAEVDRLERDQNWAAALVAARRADAVLAGGDADAATTQRVRERLKDLEFIDRLEQIRMKWATWSGGAVDYPREYARAFREYGVDIEALTVETSIDRLRRRPALAIPIATALDDWVNSQHAASPMDFADWKPLVAVVRGIDPEPLRDRIRSFWGRTVTPDELCQIAESIEIRSQHPVTLVSLAHTLKRSRQTERALRLLRDAQYVYPADFWINFELGTALYENKDSDGAIQFLTAAMAIRPDSAVAHFNLGLALYHRKKLAEAIAEFRKSTELDRKKAIYQKCLGDALALDGKLDEATTAFEEAVRLEPDNAYIHHTYGSFLRDIKRDYDGAIASFRKSVELDRNKPDYHIKLGYALGLDGKLDEAIAAYEEAFRLEPDNAYIHHAFGCFLRDIVHDYDGAVASLNKAITLDSKNIYVHADLVNALVLDGKVDEAIAPLRKAIELDPHAAWSRDNLAGCLNAAAWALATHAEPARRDGARAASLASEAVDLKPQVGDYWNTLGAAHYRAGSWNDAVAALEKSMELRKGGSSFDWFFLAMAHWHLGDKDEAREWYDRAVQWMDKNQPANEELRRFRAEASELLELKETKQDGS